MLRTTRTTSRGLVKPNRSYSSAPITLKVPVLNFNQFLATYNKVLEDVVVGCTCVLRESVHERFENCYKLIVFSLCFKLCVSC